MGRGDKRSRVLISFLQYIGLYKKSKIVDSERNLGDIYLDPKDVKIMEFFFNIIK